MGTETAALNCRVIVAVLFLFYLIIFYFLATKHRPKKAAAQQEAAISVPMLGSLRAIIIFQDEYFESAKINENCIR